MESSGGAIGVESAVGAGTAFEVFLPITEPVADVETTESAEQGPPIGTERLLYVDDEPAVADLGVLGLERLGYEVEVRTSSIDALETFRAAPERFDVVITDQTMPHMTGLELAEALLQIRPELPIILCTGFSDLVDEGVAKESGVRQYVTKPVLPRSLAEVVRQVMQAES